MMGPVQAFVPRIPKQSPTSRSEILIDDATAAAKSSTTPIIVRAIADSMLKGGMLVGAIFGGSFMAGLSSTTGIMAPVHAAVINMPRCEGGLGDGCAAMGEGNEFVKKLQERSAKNYESSKKQKLIKYNLNNFKDYFAVKNQKLVVKPDGKFIAIDNKLYKQLEKEGKVDGNYWISKEDPPSDGTVDFIPGGSKNDAPAPDFTGTN
ncbi:hypothetical protein NSK_007916 [Nannochloropsis salina CCMP1776]|uniref:Uncharacterized protein n=1 Tax=Nannochloropsis salina CCMP1776 TaxID=1027361 RepID=A0A4D9CVP2_9STRA|nr:hypothetical protein NSK_007916 [Nannochloropsis salina CCMP1776]|eukprot:TFJ80739.1 hypothetical protein NSK_007916 [Nannochloropsis salina CCMP1776]